LSEEALKRHQATLGRDHPKTLLSMINLANAYADLGRHPAALALREETLRLSRAKLGPDHPDTLMSMNNLATSYAAFRRLAEALALYEEARRLQRAKLGPDHPDTLRTMSNLANSYSECGRHAEALALREEALKLKKAKLGANHPATVGTIYDVACTHALMIAKATDRGRQADLAMDWLRQAVAAGFKNAAHIKKDPDLDPLRDREDFKKLIAELEAKAAAESKLSAEKKP
jgi:tetratricopeptide (TPR) repeat protein